MTECKNGGGLRPGGRCPPILGASGEPGSRECRFSNDGGFEPGAPGSEGMAEAMDEAMLE